MPTGRFPLLLRSALALTLAFLATLTGAVVALPASASITSPFAKRFSANTTGDILLRGNTLLTCPTAAANCVNARAGTGATLNNNNFTMGFVDIDGSVGIGAPTRSSSSADVALPTGSTTIA